MNQRSKKISIFVLILFIIGGVLAYPSIKHGQILNRVLQIGYDYSADDNLYEKIIPDDLGDFIFTLTPDFNEFVVGNDTATVKLNKDEGTTICKSMGKIIDCEKVVKFHEGKLKEDDSDYMQAMMVTASLTNLNRRNKALDTYIQTVRYFNYDNSTIEEMADIKK